MKNIYSTGTTTVDNLRLRKGASLDSEAIDVLNNGTKVNIISTENDFYKVKIGDQTGYISKKYVKTGSSANSNTTNTTKKRKQIKAIQHLIQKIRIQHQILIQQIQIQHQILI